MTVPNARDLVLSPGPGIPSGLIIPAAELAERFSRSSGPGGQSVNTTDSRVELSLDIANSASFSELQRARLQANLSSRITDGTIVLAASEERSQLRNRSEARTRLAQLLREALAPPPPPRRARRPSAAARQRRLDVKKHRAAIKAGRRAPEEG